jgi:hypothetical protein
VCPLQPCALIDGVVATQLRGGRSARRGERMHARGAVGTPW